MTKLYYHFSSTTMTPCFVFNTFRDEVKSTWLCPQCVSPRSGYQGIDVIIQGSKPTGKMNFVMGCGLPLARKELILALGQEVIDRDLYIGRVFNEKGNLIQNWVTFRGKKRIIVRGTTHAGFRICEECGKSLYFAMGKNYLCPAPDTEEHVYESNFLGLIVPERLATPLISNEWRRVYYEKLPVLDEPKDGLPVILSRNVNS